MRFVHLPHSLLPSTLLILFVQYSIINDIRPSTKSRECGSLSIIIHFAYTVLWNRTNPFGEGCGSLPFSRFSLDVLGPLPCIRMIVPMVMTMLILLTLFSRISGGLASCVLLYVALQATPNDSVSHTYSEIRKQGGSVRNSYFLRPQASGFKFGATARASW
jgi:hypothetical protein